MTVLIDHTPEIFAHATRRDLGVHAAERAADVLRFALAAQGHARVMLAAAPSQQETLEALTKQADIDWTAIEFFHMDDYLGLDTAAPQGFGNWLVDAFFSRIPTAVFHRINPVGDAQAEAGRYESVMGDAPFDLVLLGLGVNGHLAFNDPPADLQDPRGAKVVELDDVSRQQQVDEGHFATFDDVPGLAISVTIPRLLNAATVIASVPGAEKRQAVEDTLTLPISGQHPGTALRTHNDVTLFLDADSDPR
jgi:glucosamine-6-phosphate deaminase